MKTKVFFGIAIRLIILFTIGFSGTFLPELFNRFDMNLLGDSIINNKLEWGLRHYWLFWLMIFLFILSLINFVISIINIINENYDTRNW